MAFPKNHLFPLVDQQISEASRTLGHPARIYILKFLQEKGPKQFLELVRALPLAEGTVSEHLNKLRKSGLIDVEIRGLVNIYSLNLDGVELVFDLQNTLHSTLCGQINTARAKEGSSVEESQFANEGEARQRERKSIH